MGDPYGLDYGEAKPKATVKNADPYGLDYSKATAPAKPNPVVPAQAAEPSLLGELGKQYADSFGQYLSTVDVPAAINEGAARLFESRPGDDILMQGGKAAGRLANTAVQGAALAPLDEATKEIGKGTPPFLIAPKVAKKLLFDPQAQLVDEANALDQQAMIAKAQGDQEGAHNLAVAASNKRGLSIIPFGGPMIAQAAEKIGHAVDTGNPQGVAGAVLDLTGESALVGAGLQSPKAGVKQRAVALKAFVDANLEAATAKGVAFDRATVEKAAQNLPTRDLADTAAAVRQSLPEIKAQAEQARVAAAEQAKSAAIEAEKQAAQGRMAQPRPEVPATDVITEPVISPIKAKVPETAPAMPAADLAKLEKNAKGTVGEIPVNAPPVEGSPAPAMLDASEIAHLEQKGFTVDSQGRLARLVQSADRPIEDGFPRTEAAKAAEPVRETAVQKSQAVGEKPTPPDIAEQPTFTEGNKPGANYTSEQLKDFKAKNGIKDEPVQMVGKKSERGAVRPDALIGLPAEGLAKAADSLTEGRGIVAAAGNRAKDIPKEPPPPDVPQSGSVPPGELPKYAGSINLERLKGPEELKRDMVARYQADKANVDAIRKVGTKLADTEKNARALADDLAQSPEKVRSLLRKGAVDEVEINALRFYRDSLWKEAKTAREKFATSQSPLDIANAERAIAEYATIFNQTQKNASTAGRTLSTLRLFSEAQDIARSNPERALAHLRKVLGDDWEAKSAELVKRVSEIPEGDVAAFNRMIRDYHKFSSVDKVRSYWMANVLSSPGTHLQNMSGNTGHAVAELATRAGEGALDATRKLFSNKPREVYAKEALVSFAGRVGAIQDGLRATRFVMKEGAEAGRQVGVREPRYYEMPGGAKNPLNLSLRALSAEDAFFETTAISGEMQALAYRDGMKQGLKGKPLASHIEKMLADKPEWLVDGAIKQAKIETFKDSLGPVAKYAVKARDADPTHALQFLFPFAEIPINFAKSNLNYSPAGLFRIPLKGLLEKGKAQPPVKTTLSRAAIGSAVMTWAAYKATQGELTAGMPQSQSERDAWTRQGKKPYMVYITPPGAKEGQWVRMGYFGPFALTIGGVAAAHDAYQKNKNYDGGAIAKEIFTGSMQAMTNQSFNQGLLNTSNILNGDVSKLESAAASVGSGFMPASGFLRFVAQAMDTVDRKPETLKERVQVNLPILSRGVPSRLNALGEETQNSRLRPMGINDRKVQNPDIEKELSRLEYAPSVKTAGLRVENDTKELDRDQLREFQKQLGDARKTEFRDLFASDEYKDMTNEEKLKAVERADKRAYQSVRDVFVEGHAMKSRPKKSKLSSGVN